MMSPKRHSPTIENYLGILFVLQRDQEMVTGVRLAELLGVSPPTVTNTLKRMTRDGLVANDEARGPMLTEAGQQAARSVMRRHMLTEWMLARMLSWSKLHHQAHDLEHAISDEVEKALLEEWNSPELCPHGNPMPGHEAAVSAWHALTSVAAGQVVIVRRIHELAEETPGLLSFLEERHVMPGVQALVEEVLPFNETITLRLEDGFRVTLGTSTARYIYVELG